MMLYNTELWKNDLVLATVFFTFNVYASAFLITGSKTQVVTWGPNPNAPNAVFSDQEK